MKYGEVSGLTPSPELEALFAETMQNAAAEVIQAGKNALYSNISRISSAASYAISFISDQAQHPCPHGGADETCECYPHRARRWVARHKEQL